uniref:G-protein coupled receptors family 1 profile domain-containing protein n=2 Tax=Caenorhabditis japonica TaxID=281687 RepID=A0A8R1HMW1_CAEJA
MFFIKENMNNNPTDKFNQTDEESPPIFAPLLTLDPISRLMFHIAATNTSSSTSPPSEDDPLQELIDRINRAQLEECDRLANSCENRPLYTWLVGYGFIFVFLLALFGNVVNLLIYNSDHIKYYIAIRMLCTRLLMNSLTLIFVLPQALRIISAWEPGSNIDEIYWSYYPYQIYFVNLFGFCAMWLTVLMTAECYLHVFFPSHSKSLCTKRNLSRSYLIILSTGATLALMYKFNRSVTLTTHCNRVIPSIHASEDFIMICLEKIHTFANLLLAIVVPMGLLLFMAISILWKLVLKRTDFVSHFT